jgi:hypothetical protein
MSGTQNHEILIPMIGLQAILNMRGLSNIRETSIVFAMEFYSELTIVIPIALSLENVKGGLMA